MIYTQGDLFSVSSGVIAHGCNCHGVMGSGVAKQVKNYYPDAFLAYKKLCDGATPEALLGKAQLVKVTDKLYIANLFTQLNYGKNGVFVNYDAVGTSFKELRALVFDEEVNKEHPNQLTINIPKIGAGLGGGDWDIISNIIDKEMWNRKVLCWVP